MKRIPITSILCMIVMIAFIFCSFAHAAITPEQMAAKMDLGVAVSWQRNISRYTTYEVQQFASRGVDHIRIRTDLDANDDLFLTANLDGCIQDVLDNGMVAVLAYSPVYWELDPSPENLAIWRDWWETCAIRYQNYPEDLIFDLIIEVDGSSLASKDDGTLLNNAYEAIVSKIRETNPTRIIAIQPQRRGDPYRFPLLSIPSQGNGYIMGEWHEGYANGPKQKPASSSTLWTTGTPEEQALITNRIAAAVDWTQSTGAPTWEGAVMPGNYNDGDKYTIEEQIGFISFFCSELNNAGIPCSLNAGHHFWDYETQAWIPGRVDVLDAAIASYNGGSGNSPPSFTSDPIVEPDATENVAYSGSIADDAQDPDPGDILTFSAQSGPAWLNVAADGALSGTPGAGDVGANSWTVLVNDGNGGNDSATLEITVDASGPSLPGQATDPNPAHNARKIVSPVTLSWTAGTGATSHDVYFGTSSGNLVFQGNQSETTFDTGSLSGKTKHYWRIDEVNDTGTTTGAEWKFTTK